MVGALRHRSVPQEVSSRGTRRRGADAPARQRDRGLRKKSSGSLSAVSWRTLPWRRANGPTRIREGSWLGNGRIQRSGQFEQLRKLHPGGIRGSIYLSMQRVRFSSASGYEKFKSIL